MSGVSFGCVRVEAPDELAAVLLRYRLEPLFRCEIERLDERRWEVRVGASGQAVARVLALAREWLAAERIAATTVMVDGEAQILERPPPCWPDAGRDSG